MPFNHFDIISGIYDRWGRFDRRHPMLEMLDPPESGRILDIGGGTGRVAQVLTGGGRQVVVIDTSSGMLRKACGKQGIIPLMSDSSALPFPPVSIDRVIIVDALHHIKKQSETIAEIDRLLKPGGVAMVVEPDLKAFIVKLIVIMEFLLMMNSHFLNRDQLVGLFDRYSGKTTSRTWQGNVIVHYKK